MSDRELLREVILIQVADLYGMRGTSGPNEDGLSPDGNVWNNIEVFEYLRAGISGMISHSSEDKGFQDCDWGCLAVLLETGRLME